MPSTVPGELPELPGFEIARYASRGPVPSEHRDAEALLVWGSRGEALREIVASLDRLRWVQTLAAGPDAVLDAGLADGVLVTSGRGLHDGPVASTPALTLAAVRRLDRTLERRRRSWQPRLGRGRPETRTDPFARRCPRADLGFGSIASRLAPLTPRSGPKVTGVATTAGNGTGSASSPARTSRPSWGARTCVMILPSRRRPTTPDARLLALLPRTRGSSTSGAARRSRGGARRRAAGWAARRRSSTWSRPSLCPPVPR